MDQKRLFRRTSQSHARLEIIFTLGILQFILNACGPTLQKSIFRESSARFAVVTVVDPQFKIVQTGHSMSGSMREEEYRATFYDWIFDGLKSAASVYEKELVLFDDKTVMSAALDRGLHPIALFKGNNPKRDILHLAFDDNEMQRLCAVAHALGAKYVLRAKLIENDLKQIPANTDPKQVRLLPSVTATISLTGGIFSVDTYIRTATIECAVWNAQTAEMILSQEVSAVTSYGLGAWLFADAALKSRLGFLTLSILVYGTGVPGEGRIVNVGTGYTLTGENSSGFARESQSFDVVLEQISLEGKGVINCQFSFWNRGSENAMFRINREQEKLSAQMTDEWGAWYSALSVSFPRDQFEIRPGERKRFSVYFKRPVLPTSFFHIVVPCDVQVSWVNKHLDLEFNKIPVPWK